MFLHRRTWIGVLVLACVARGLWLLSAYTGVAWQLPAATRFLHVTPAGLGYNYTPLQAIDLGLRADAVFYLTIAADGYVRGDPTDLRVAFFPLFPALIAAVHRILGLTLPIAALVLANLCDVGGWLMTAAVAYRRLGKARAWSTMVAFALFPTRNFGFAAYTEGLFLLLSMGAFWLYETQRIRRAAWCCVALAATRPQGVLVGVALTADALWRKLRRQPGAASADAIACLAMAPAGLVAYMVYLGRHVGDPAAFLHVQSTWRRHLTWPWRTLFAHGEPQDHVAMWLAVLLILGMLLRRVAPRDWLYPALAMAVSMSTGSVQSMARFVGMLVPLFIFAGGTVEPQSRRAKAYVWVAACCSVIVAFKLGRGVRIT